MTQQLNQLPKGLPVPQDDDACDHLQNHLLPSMPLLATSGNCIDLSSYKSVVIYCYPMTGEPNTPLPDGWEEVPGARGCTPQSCAFRDHYKALQDLGAEVYGLSTQTSEYQLEAKKRLHLPFELVSDQHFKFSSALNLPTFQVENMTLLKRVTLIVQLGVITKVFYPVFPPDQNADQVIKFLNEKT